MSKRWGLLDTLLEGPEKCPDIRGLAANSFLGKKVLKSRDAETQSPGLCTQGPGCRNWLNPEYRQEQIPAWTHSLSPGWLNMYSLETRAVREM